MKREECIEDLGSGICHSEVYVKKIIPEDWEMQNVPSHSYSSPNALLIICAIRHMRILCIIAMHTVPCKDGRWSPSRTILAINS